MDLVQVNTSAHDGHELSQRVPAFRQPILIRSQVAGDNVRTKIGSVICTPLNIKRKSCEEVVSSGEIRSRVGLLRHLSRGIQLPASATPGVGEYAFPLAERRFLGESPPFT
jgi:hypothetical protein